MLLVRRADSGRDRYSFWHGGERVFRGVVTRSSTTLVGNEGAWVLAVVGLLVLPGALALLAAAALTPVGPRPV